MEVLILTIFLSVLLAAGFVAFFLHLDKGLSDPSRDPLLPLRDDSGPANPKQSVEEPERRRPAQTASR